jgi:RNA polymerase sigma factor (sigma-70 family)
MLLNSPPRKRTVTDALRRRDWSAAERLLETYGDRVYRLALRITGNEEDTEEAVHDAFWSVVRNIDTFRGESLFGSRIYRITANAAYQKLRRVAHGRDEIPLDQALPISKGRIDHGLRLERPSPGVYPTLVECGLSDLGRMRLLPADSEALGDADEIGERRRAWAGTRWRRPR